MNKQMVSTTSTPALPTLKRGHELLDLHAILYDELLERHGPIIGGLDLAHAMGYRSLAAFRQARRRGQVEVQLFSLPNRRGVFALVAEVARWLANASQVNRTVTEVSSKTSVHSGGSMPIE